jgi:hypothetical protein
LKGRRRAKCAENEEKIETMMWSGKFKRVNMVDVL